jgi:coproporphyrinogen III oxidase-like Fe-S oxidoreductase
VNRVDSKFDEIHEKSRFKDKASLYVHVPFCRRLCPYCSFNRYHYNENNAKDYFENLTREIEFYRSRGFVFDQVYFGGGTPTADMPRLLSFLDFLSDNFNIKQVSLETNPSDVNQINLKDLASKNVKRLSIGIQSFEDGILKSTGRGYLSGEELKETIASAKGIFNTLNIDLIFNFPTQTVEQFKRDITTFKELDIDQVTFYPLMPSPRRKNALEKRFNRIDISQETKMYQLILDELLDGGVYAASTPWCFTRISRDKQMIDEYIVDYDDYVGTGSGAVSQLGGVFYVNSFSLERYGRMVKKGRLPVIGWRPLSTRETHQYFLLTKLFGLKVDKNAFQQRFGREMASTLRLEILILKSLGMVKERDGIMLVTKRGMFHVSTLMKEFFASLNGLREYCITNKL